MRCEDFDPERYVLDLMGIAHEELKPESALERYLHIDTCEKDRKRFEEYITHNYKPYDEERGLIYEGLKRVGYIVDED